MNLSLPRCFALALGLAVAPALVAQMSVDSFDGPLTANELSTFKTNLKNMQPVVWPNTGSMQTEYAQGKTGEAIKAMGLMYELTGDLTILDRMIYYCDVLLSERNDILAAPYGHRTIWTNTVAPVWPGSVTDPASADSANGDCVGHLAYCARLILQTPSILSTAVGNGDVYGHGSTYGGRAATFIAEADYVWSQFFFPSLLDLSGANKLYFSLASPYMSGGVMPWNQQMMMTYGLQNLAAAHAILGDNPSLVSQYDGIVQTNLNWFFNDTTGTVIQSYTDTAGNTAYKWGYNPTLNNGEDSNHGNLDIVGFYRAYLSGRYGITSAKLAPVANMYADVMLRGHHNFAGRVDGTDGTGHGAATTYARTGAFLLTEMRPDKYYDLISANLSVGGTTTSMETFSRFAWVKSRRAQAGYVVGFSPAPGATTTAPTVTLSTSVGGASLRYTIDGSTPTATTGILYTTPIALSATTTIKVVSVSGSTASPVSTATYHVIAQTPTFSPVAGTYGTSQAVTISSATSGATIRYTTDGSMPSATTGTVYTGPVTISATSTLRAAAYTASLEASLVTTGSYTIGTPASAPTFSVAGGTYASAQTVTLSTATSGATIRYTTDGSTPSDTVGTVYSAALSIPATAKLQAIAYKSGLLNSSVASATYFIGSNTVASPTFGTASGTYNGAQSVSLSTTTPDATILFTTDGSSPTSTTGMVYVYTGPINVTKNTTINAYASSALYTNSSSVVAATYNIAVAAPTATPAPGTYASAQSVTLSSATSGASIRYTTDGSTPTSSTGTLYTGAINVSTSTTIKAIAYSSGMADSSVTTAAYTINTSGVTATSGDGLHNTALSSAQTGTFTVQFDWAATVSPINSLFALSATAPSAYTGCAVIIRLNPSGLIDARNGGVYAAVTSIPYSAGLTYHFRVVTNVTAHTYSAYVTAPGGSEQTLATNYAFRTEQNAVTSIGYWSVAADPSPVGSTTITNFALALAQVAAPSFSPAGGTFTSAQSVTITSTTSGATIRYTTDGSTPTATTGTVYSGAVSIGSTTTLKAIAYKSGMSDSTVTSATYTITATPAKITVPSANVTASTYTSTYVPANTVDGSTSTRWAANGDGVWIQYDLGATKTVSYVKLAWYLGDTRTYTFDVQVATNSAGPWTTVLASQTNAANTSLQTVDFTDVSARYVRIVGHRSNVDGYCNLTETEVWGF